jgi:hypothetical protein
VGDVPEEAHVSDTERETVEAQLQILWPTDAEARFPPPIYTNYVGASFTPEDFVLSLGWYTPPLRGEVSPDGTLQIEVQPVAKVVLPLNLLRNLIALLQLQLDAYEANFGPVPEHPNKPAWLQEKEAESSD